MRKFYLLHIVLMLSVVLFSSFGFSQSVQNFKLNNVRDLQKSTISQRVRARDLKAREHALAGVGAPDSKGLLIKPEDYPTMNLIDREHLAWDLKKIKKQQKANYDSLALFAVRQDEVLNAKTSKNHDRLAELYAEVEIDYDSAHFRYVKDFISHRRFLSKFGSTRSKAFFDLIYNNNGKSFNTLSSAGIGFGKNTGSIYSELVSGNLGFFRASVGAMVTGNNNEDKEEAKQEEAYQRLATNGGNTSLMLEHPLIYAHSRNTRHSALLRAVVKGAADIPVFGTSTDKFAGNGSMGLDFYAFTSTDNGAISFFFNANYNGIVGTDEFRANLNLGKKFITLGQLSAGLIISDRIRISFNFLTFSNDSSLRNKRVIANGQVLK